MRRSSGAAGLAAGATDVAGVLRPVPGVDDDAQRDLGAEELVQHGRDVGLEPVLDPVACERRLHGQDDLRRASDRPAASA